MSLVDLLCDEDDKNNSILVEDYEIEDKILIESIMFLLLKKAVYRVFDSVY